MTESPWQPIETAPKDGTPILGRHLGGGWDGGDLYAVVQWSTDYGPPGFWDLVVHHGYEFDREWAPAEWQPIPTRGFPDLRGRFERTLAAHQGEGHIRLADRLINGVRAWLTP